MSIKIREYPGVHIKTRDLREGKIPLLRWRPKAKYTWCAGSAISTSLTDLKEGKIIGRK